MASFKVNLNMRILHIYIEEMNPPSSSNVRVAPSKKKRVLMRVLQADIARNLKTCLDAYMNENQLTGGEVSVLMNFKPLHNSKVIQSFVCFLFFSLIFLGGQYTISLLMDANTTSA